MTGVNNDVGYLPPQFVNRSVLFYDPQSPIYNPQFLVNKITRGNDTFYNVSLELDETFTGNITFELEYLNSSTGIDIEVKEERLVSAMLPVFPSLDHRLVMELRGFSASVLSLQTEWI